MAQTKGKKGNEAAAAAPEDSARARLRRRETVMLSKIRLLYPEQQDELGATIDRMLEENKSSRGDELVTAIAALSDEALNRIWNNPKDAEYDDL